MCARPRSSAARADGRLYAFGDLCTHGNLPPASRAADRHCQRHGSRFDITTGAILNGPAAEPLDVYEVKEVGGEIQARI
jgi:nitrite reductase/ring-hydroxylating ferredoxin subunit